MTCPPATAVRKIELTQGKVALVDAVDYEYLMRWNWYAMWNGRNWYARRSVRSVNGLSGTKTFMHTEVAKRICIDHTRIDHIDQNTLNNCQNNLRYATVSQNGHNRGVQKNSITGVKGVQRIGKRYRARIKLHGKRYWLGHFDTIAEAEKVVIAKRKELVGEFACNDRRTV